MALATLSIDLEAKFANLEQGLRNATSAVQTNAKQMQGSLDDLGKTSALVSGLLKGAFIGLATGGAAAAFRSIIGGVDALNDLKDATGSSIEKLSALEDIGARTGTSFESVSSTLVKFNKVLNESTPGSATANLLKSIGLEAAELKKLDPAEALQRTAIALQGFADDGNKARIIQDLFGKSVREAAPFLKDLAEAGKLVGTVTTQQAEEAEKFNKQLFAFKKNSEDAARAFVGTLLPALNELVEGFRRGRGEGKNFLLAWLDSIDEVTKKMGGFDPAGLALRGAKASSQELQRQVSEAGANVDRIQKLFNVNPTGTSTAEALKKAKDRLLELTQAAGAANEKLKLVVNAPADPDFGHEGNRAKRSALATKPAPDQERKQTDLEKYIETLEKAQLAVLDLTKSEEVELEIASGKFKDLTPRAAEYLRLLARGIDLAKKPQDFIGPSIGADVLKQRADAQRDLNKLLDESGAGKFNGLVDLTNSLIDAQRDGAVSAEQYASAMALLQKKFEDLAPQAKAVLGEMDQFAKQAASNIQDALGDNVASVLSGNFDDIEQRWKSLLINMVSQAAAAQLAKVLFGDFGSTGSIGGLFGSLIGAGAGGGGGTGGTGPAIGSIGALSVVDAGGGRASAQSARSSGSITINQTNSFGAGVGRGEVTAAMAENNRALLAGLRAQGKL